MKKTRSHKITEPIKPDAYRVRTLCFHAMTTRQMKLLLRTAGIPIPKYKDEMLQRLAISSEIQLHITVTASPATHAR